MRRFLLFLIPVMTLPLLGQSPHQLTVDFRETPLGIDNPRPRFGWRMAAPEGERGVFQTGYRLVVRDPRGRTVWDSGRVRSRESQNIAFQGPPLAPATRYEWRVTVWDHHGRSASAASWFETGLMDPSPEGPAWRDAQWIGGGAEDLVLYAPYLSVFELGFTVSIAAGSTRAGFVYGANDSRLMDRNRNIWQLESARDRSYILLELDISGLEASPNGRALLHVYRAGYHPGDDPATPFRTFEIPATVIHAGNRHDEHRVELQSAFGFITIAVDGSSGLRPAGGTAQESGRAPSRRLPPNSVNLNPAGLGWDYLPFGMLCDIGFSLRPGQRASFRDVEVRHHRLPRNLVFQEDLSAQPYTGIFAGAAPPGGGFTVSGGRYRLDGGARGLFLARDPSRNSMPMLRTEFRTRSQPVASARLYVTARGIYEFYLNGRRVGDAWYAPGLTQYNRTHLYQTYDVTPWIRAGDNAMGAMLGEGWWSGLLSFGTIWNHFGDRQSLRARLVVTYADGSSDVFTSNDRTWKYYAAGPVLYGSMTMGEVYDATREEAVRGWAEPGFDDSRWQRASVVPLEGAAYLDPAPPAPSIPLAMPLRLPPLDYSRMQLVGQIDEPAGIFQVLKAKSVREARPGVFVYDLGQNITGVPRITFAEGEPGRKITLRFSEMLYPDLPESGKNAGMIMTENYRAALSQDVYVMKAGPQQYQPRFTQHGFQYIEITGIGRPLPLEAVEGLAISSVRKLTAEFTSSNGKVNRLWQNIVWSNVDNFLWVPTDCPQRNERMGWSGDLNVFSRTATYVSGAAAFLRRHLRAMRDTQSPEGRFADIAPVGGGFGGILWGAAGIVVPWESYLQYGDLALLEEHFAAMAAYMNYLESAIDPKTGLIRDAALGDWLRAPSRLRDSPSGTAGASRRDGAPADVPIRITGDRPSSGTDRWKAVAAGPGARTPGDAGSPSGLTPGPADGILARVSTPAAGATVNARPTPATTPGRPTPRAGGTPAAGSRTARTSPLGRAAGRGAAGHSGGDGEPTPPLDVGLGDLTIAGRVLSQAKDPVPGIEVTARPVAAQAGLPASGGSGISGDDGRYEIRGLTEGEYTIRTTASDRFRSGGIVARAGFTSADIVLEAGDAIRHTHISTVPARTYPVRIEPGFLPFFANLKAIGYQGRMSIEAQTDNFREDAAAALSVLRQLGR